MALRRRDMRSPASDRKVFCEKQKAPGYALIRRSRSISTIAIVYLSRVHSRRTNCGILVSISHSLIIRLWNADRSQSTSKQMR